MEYFANYYFVTDSLSYPRFDLTKNFCWIAGHNRVGRNIFRDHRARPHNGVFSNAGIGENGRAGADRGSFLNYRSFHAPVSFGLQAACGGCRARVEIVNEHHTVSDEDVVFDVHAFTNKRVARNLAAFAYGRVLLYLDESSDFGFVANLAAIEVDELGK